jgi:hypothetical protein
MWKILATNEYLLWFSTLSDIDQEAIKIGVNLLAEFGPNLGRPHTDTLYGTKTKNLKELRSQSKKHVFRIAFYFNPKRQGILLIGGDKKGKNEEDFYADLIKQAENLIEKYKDITG